MKNCEEWSLEFDLMYNNITSNQAPGLTEYEKSVFLTRAQKSLVVSLYNGTLGRSFEETEEVTAYLNSLVKQTECELASGDLPHIVQGSVIYSLPEDLLFRTYERCTISVGDCGELDAVVVPVTQDEFWRTNRNPFKGPNRNKVLRLSYSESLSDEYTDEQEYSEIVSKYPVSSYAVRYVSKPEPIILENFADGQTIDGESTMKTCKLNEAFHQTILTTAVQMAKAIWESR